MEQELTPQQSFDLISKIIDNRRRVYEENGQNILMWGVVVILAGIGQYALIHTSHADKSGLVWLFTMVPMFFYTMYINANARSKNTVVKRTNKEWDVSGMAWFMAGTMAMLNGFIFRDLYGTGFITVMYLPFGIAALVTAMIIKKIYFIYLTLVATVVAFVALYIPHNFHSLISAVIAFLMFFLPGLALRSDYKKREDV